MILFKFLKIWFK